METMRLHGPVQLRDPLAADVHALPPVARRIFTETFGHLFDAQAFEAFCEEAFGPGGTMARDLADPGIDWCIAEDAGLPIGYAKLRPLAAPAPQPKRGAMELQQIYLSAERHGTGIADALMQWALRLARAKGAPEIYLTVFDHNQRAKRFYARHGFDEVGHCAFQLGERVYDDRVWRKALG